MFYFLSLLVRRHDKSFLCNPFLSLSLPPPFLIYLNASLSPDRHAASRADLERERGRPKGGREAAVPLGHAQIINGERQMAKKTTWQVVGSRACQFEDVASQTPLHDVINIVPLIA